MGASKRTTRSRKRIHLRKGRGANGLALICWTTQCEIKEKKCYSSGPVAVKGTRKKEMYVGVVARGGREPGIKRLGTQQSKGLLKPRLPRKSVGKTEEKERIESAGRQTYSVQEKDELLWGAELYKRPNRRERLVSKISLSSWRRKEERTLVNAAATGGEGKKTGFQKKGGWYAIP